jgi:flagellar motor component MotA
MKIKVIIGFVVMVTLTALAMETPLAFVNIPSILIVFGLIIGGTLASGRKICSVGGVFFKKNPTTEELWSASDTYRYMKDLAIGAGIVGTLIGLVLMLKNLEDPTQIGPSMAVALLTLLYSVMLRYFIFDPLAIFLEEQSIEKQSKEFENKKLGE